MLWFTHPPANKVKRPKGNSNRFMHPSIAQPLAFGPISDGELPLLP